MTKEDFLKEKAELKAKFDEDIKLLCRKFAFANNSISVGDIIEDYAGLGKVLKIKHTITLSSSTPECVYVCVDLTKSGKPFKRYKESLKYQSNLKTSQ